LERRTFKIVVTDLETIHGQIALKDATATHKVNLCKVAAVALLLYMESPSAAFTLTHRHSILASFKVPFPILADMQDVAIVVMLLGLNTVNVILITEVPVMLLVCYIDIIAGVVI
jgi:hypothetical protein